MGGGRAGEGWGRREEVEAGGRVEGGAEWWGERGRKGEGGRVGVGEGGGRRGGEVHSICSIQIETNGPTLFMGLFISLFLVKGTLVAM